jgi:tRNA (guanine-N7-)-methyltransferase
MQTKHELVVEPNGVTPESLPKPIDWRTMFGNDNPVEIEIGCGKGTFITTQALARPAVNFFGIEWARWYWRYTSDRLRRHQCTNARATRADADFFLHEYVADASVDVVHIYFPDPWPKARHHKRRLIQPKLMPKVQRVLRPGGVLKIVTDHVDYWEQIEATVRASPLSVIEYERPDGAHEGEMVGTNFERKFIDEGRPFYAIAARKA